MNDMPATLRWWAHRSVGTAFDMLHNIDTTAVVPPGTLGVTSPNRNAGVPYDPSPWRTLHRSLRLAGIRKPDGLTFVDIGCGKGKVVLSAITLPFRRIIGLDFSPYLCEVARQNVDSARLLRRRCSNVEIVCADATEWTASHEPAVFFFCNPFHIEVMEAVLRNLMDSHIHNPRRMYMIFFKASSSVTSINQILSETGPSSVIRVASGKFGKDSVNIYCLPAP